VDICWKEILSYPKEYPFISKILWSRWASGPRPAGVLPPGTSVPRPAEGVEVPRPTRTRSDSDWWEPAGPVIATRGDARAPWPGRVSSPPAGVASCPQPRGPGQCLGGELTTVSPRGCSSKADLSVGEVREAATALSSGWTGGLRLTVPDSPLRVPHPRWPSDDPEWPRVARGGAGHSERPPPRGVAA
jgi:hypothetical protein